MRAISGGGTEPNRADRLDGPVLDGSSNKRKLQYNSKRRPVPVVHLDSVLDFLGSLRNLRRDSGSGVDFTFQSTDSLPHPTRGGLLVPPSPHVHRRRGRSRAWQRAQERKKELDEDLETVPCTT